jgi:hypothetical protein
MEAAALGFALEGAVERLIPPAAREAVLGDLRESYARRGDYLREILKAAPYVIASQMTRHLNLPVLMLQGAMIFWFFDGRMVALALPLLMLREAYQPLARPDPRVALRGAVALSFASLLVGLATRMPLSQALLILLLAGPLSFVLCGLRTSVILGIDRYDTVLPDAMPLAALRARHGDFLRRQRRRRRLDIAALGVAALCWPLLIERSLSVPLSAVFLAAALYQFKALLCDERETPTNFARLAQHYADQMQDDAQFRRFLCWLWVVPGLCLIQTGMVSGIAPPVQIVLHVVLTVLLCFGAGAINREKCGRVREEISLLGVLRETPPILA